MKQKYTGFTLVELIVVITILAILWTIGFISFQWYTVQARDSKRTNDINILSRSLEYYALKEGLYPEPDNSINILASGALVWKQWLLWQNALIEIWFSEEWTDPVSWDYYSYFTLIGGTHMQLLWLMEKENSAGIQNTSSTFAWEYSTRFPKTYGNKLWLLTDFENNPLNSLSGSTDIDLVLTSTGYTSYVSSDRIYSGDGTHLRYAVPQSSCQRIADLNKWWANGLYNIYPIAGEAISVYCDFTSDPEWWALTLVARSVDDAAFNSTPFWWYVSRWNPWDDWAPYSLWTIIKDIPFEKVYLWVYDTWKNITWFTTLNVNDLDIFDNAYSNTALAVEWCQWEPITITGIGTIDSCMAFNLWGKFASTESYWFSYNPTDPDDGLNRRRYWASFPYPWMIFVK